MHDGIVGSVTHATDSQGRVRNEYAYEAFGTRTTQSNSSASHQHYGYTGEEYDEETGLVYLRARYYDPSLGRFISADPYLGRLAEPVTQNRYIYAHNRPLLFTDPTGLVTFGISFNVSGGAVLGGTTGYYFGFDDDFNFAAYQTTGGGTYIGASWVYTANIEITLADTIDMLEGTGAQGGLSVGEGVILEGGAIMGENSDGLPVYGGIYFGGGFGGGSIPVAVTSFGTITTPFELPLNSGIIEFSCQGGVEP